MSDRRIAPGDILARKYRAERILGSGNMGVVVAATHVDLGQLVAIKQMLPGKDDSPELRGRFLREARAAVRLKSQHVARVLDVGTDENDAPYIVMEFLEGRDLADVLKADGPLPFGQAAEYVLQACEAVGEAHAAGIVHRDLKPANLFLTRDVSGAPCVKVVDFGISKSNTDMTLTQDEQALGSPLFMSPEAMYSAKNIDARSDIYALGVILYQLVAGHKKAPFQAETVPELCRRVLYEDPTPLAEHRPDAPPGFEAIILKCIDRDKEKRFQNAAELAAALLPCAPARAQMYGERIARVVGVKLSATNSISLADLNGTMPLMPAPIPNPAPSVPVANAAQPALQGTIVLPGSASTPSLAVTSAENAMSNPQGAAPDKPRRAIWFLVAAAVLLGIPAILFGIQLVGSATPAPASAPETNASPPPLTSSAAPVITPIGSAAPIPSDTAATSNAPPPETAPTMIAAPVEPRSTGKSTPLVKPAATPTPTPTTRPAPTPRSDVYDER